MISFEEMGDMLDQLSEELPKEFFDQLNGGVLLLPQLVPHPKSINNDLFILGTYRFDRALGSRIEIYYGSFERLFGSASRERIEQQLRSTLRHEFRHHLERLSGTRDLEIEDENNLAQYLKRYDD